MNALSIDDEPLSITGIRARGTTADREIIRVRRDDCPSCSYEDALSRQCSSRWDDDADVPALLGLTGPMCRWASIHSSNIGIQRALAERTERLRRAGLADERLIRLVAGLSKPPEMQRAWFPDAASLGLAERAWRWTHALVDRAKGGHAEWAARAMLALYQGERGTGKSARAAYVLARTVGEGLWLPSIAVDTPPDEWGEVARRARSVRVLVIDDLGVERHTSTGWGQEQLRDMIVGRYNSSLPTIVTTNLPLDRVIRDYGGDRLASRWSEGGVEVPCGGVDLRPILAKREAPAPAPMTQPPTQPPLDMRARAAGDDT